MPLPELIRDLEEALVGGIQIEFEKTRRVLNVLDRHNASPTTHRHEVFMAALDDLHTNLTVLAGNVAALIAKTGSEGADTGAKAELDAQNATLAQFAAGVATINTQVLNALSPPVADPAPPAGGPTDPLPVASETPPAGASEPAPAADPAPSVLS